MTLKKSKRAYMLVENLVIGTCSLISSIYYYGRVTYQGVNYWGKNIEEEHEAKGCDDQIQSIALKVKWPEMTSI